MLFFCDIIYFMKKLKEILDCIYVYPIAVILTFVVLFVIFDRSLTLQSNKYTSQIMTQSLLQRAYMVKGLVEEYSFLKNRTSINKNIKKIAAKDKGFDFLALTHNGVVLYSNETSAIGTTIKTDKLFLKQHQVDKIYRKDNSTLSVVLKIHYLYNPFTKQIQNGYLLLVQNIKMTLQNKHNGMLITLRWLFVIATVAVLILFYLFNIIFVKKIKKIEVMSEELSNDTKTTEPTNLNSIINRLEKTTLRLKLLSKVVEYSNDSIIITDSNRHIISVNKAFEHITGYKDVDAIGKDPRDVFASGLTSDQFYQNMYKSIDKYGRFEGELLNRRKDGSNYLAWINVWSLQDDKTKQITNYVAISKDISEILKKQKEIERLAYFDTLTGLANREYFLKLLHEIITLKKQKHESFGLILMDIDAFKEINDTIGYKEGDTILQDFTTQLKSLNKAEDIVARTGGDEFAIILTSVDNPTDALEEACKILDIKLHNKRKINISIGVAMFPTDGESSDALLAAGNIAMNYSKQNSNTKCTFFQQEMQKEITDKITLKEELKYAIEHNELQLFYQPKFSLKDKKLKGFEALIRWQHPTKGFIYPDTFIPLAEESRLIIDMTAWVLKEVSVACKQFIKFYPDFGSIAINISAQHFKTMGLVTEIKSLIDSRCMKANHIGVEITESAVMRHFDATNMQLNQLRDMGISIALDDYGTGYSSLTYLKKLPIDIIKIDKSFVDGLCHNKADFAIVKSSIDLAKSLGLETVIEGVEDDEQLSVLRKLGADTIQGYVYSKPLSRTDTEALLTNLAAKA